MDLECEAVIGGTVYLRMKEMSEDEQPLIESESVELTAIPHIAPANSEIGSRSSHDIGDLKLHMRLAPASAFPTGEEDDGEATVDTPFWIAETQVTYELWWTVYT